MKNIRTLLFVAASAATLSVNAATIQFASNSTAADSTQNNSVGNNVVIDKNPAWADALAGSNWISFENTGNPSSAGFTTIPNGTVVSFFQHFTLGAADTFLNGTVSLYADDSSSVVLNGHTIVGEASGTGNTYGTCSDTRPNCVSLTTVVLPSAYLVAGSNVLEFDVAQRAGSSFGLDYKGSVGAAATPEPSTWAFMTSGLLAVGTGIRKRLRRSIS